MKSLHYYLTEEDYLDYLLFRNEDGRKKQVRLTRIILLVCALALPPLMADSMGSLLMMYAILIPMFTAFFLLMPRSIKRSQRRLLSRVLREGRPAQLGDHTLALRGDRIEHILRDRAFAYAYSCVERVVLSGRCIFICTSALGAIVLPLRAFATPLHRDEFMTMLRAGMDAARPPQAPQGAVQSPAEMGAEPPESAQPAQADTAFEEAAETAAAPGESETAPRPIAPDPWPVSGASPTDTAPGENEEQP